MEKEEKKKLRLFANCDAKNRSEKAYLIEYSGRIRELNTLSTGSIHLFRRIAPTSYAAKIDKAGVYEERQRRRSATSRRSRTRRPPLLPRCFLLGAGWASAVSSLLLIGSLSSDGGGQSRSSSWKEDSHLASRSSGSPSSR